MGKREARYNDSYDRASISRLGCGRVGVKSWNGVAIMDRYREDEMRKWKEMEGRISGRGQCNWYDNGEMLQGEGHYCEYQSWRDFDRYEHRRYEHGAGPVKSRDQKGPYSWRNDRSDWLRGNRSSLPGDGECNYPTSMHDGARSTEEMYGNGSERVSDGDSGRSVG